MPQDDIDYQKLAAEVVEKALESGMSRRDVISAMAGAGAGAAAIAMTADRASAQDTLVIDGVDQIGRDNDRVSTLYVEEINNYTSTETFDTIDLNQRLSNYGGTYYEKVTVASSLSGNVTIDISQANVFNHTISGDTTYSFTGASNNLNGASFVIKVAMSGSNSITWPSSVVWNGGSKPEDPADGSEMEVSFITYNGGNTWYGRKSWGAE